MIEEGIATEVRRAATVGRLADGVSPESVIASTTLAMQGLMAVARSGLPPAGLRERARQAVDVFARGTYTSDR